MYKWNGMIKISYAEALQKYNNNEEVYLLYEDDTEALALSLKKKKNHSIHNGELGYEK